MYRNISIEQEFFYDGRIRQDHVVSYTGFEGSVEHAKLLRSNATFYYGQARQCVRNAKVCAAANGRVASRDYVRRMMVQAHDHLCDARTARVKAAEIEARHA